MRRLIGSLKRSVVAFAFGFMATVIPVGKALGSSHSDEDIDFVIFTGVAGGLSCVTARLALRRRRAHSPA